MPNLHTKVKEMGSLVTNWTIFCFESQCDIDLLTSIFRAVLWSLTSMGGSLHMSSFFDARQCFLHLEQ